MVRTSREPQTHKTMVVTFGPDVMLTEWVGPVRNLASVVLYFALVFDKKKRNVTSSITSCTTKTGVMECRFLAIGTFCLEILSLENFFFPSLDLENAQAFGIYHVTV